MAVSIPRPGRVRRAPLQKTGAQVLSGDLIAPPGERDGVTSVTAAEIEDRDPRRQLQKFRDLSGVSLRAVRCKDGAVDEDIVFAGELGVLSLVCHMHFLQVVQTDHE